MWEKLKQLEIPKNQEVFCVTTVFRHYGHGIAWAATGNIEKAYAARDRFRASANLVPPTRLDFPNRIVDIQKVASEMLDRDRISTRQF
jgi:hypothetical protein